MMRATMNPYNPMAPLKLKITISLPPNGSIAREMKK